MPRALLLLAVVAVGPAAADFYDVLSPHLLPPAGGCKEWADVPEMDVHWVGGKPPAGAGSACAQQGRGNPAAGFTPADMGAANVSHALGAYCVSKASGKVAACTSAFGVPEQVNVQLASQDAVVLAFITHERTVPTAAPLARLSGAGCELAHGEATLKGVTHKHLTTNGRVYYMHFVKAGGLAPRASYCYAVKSGAADAAWSANFTFRAPYGEGKTVIDLYGDMGVYTWNNMGNLYQDLVVDKSADLVIHAGDHGYNEGDVDEHRGDGYMQAFEQTLANGIWLPSVGNHEAVGTNLSRYLDSTWEEWGPLPNAAGSDGAASFVEHLPAENVTNQSLVGVSSATSALGQFLATGGHHAAGLHSRTPSHSSRYFSADLGLVHLVALDLNIYNGDDPCLSSAKVKNPQTQGTNCKAEQIAWLKEDLASVDRAKTPWVFAFSHFPMYVTQWPDDLDKPLSQEPWWAAEACEYSVAGRNCSAPPGWEPDPDALDLQLQPGMLTAKGLPANCPVNGSDSLCPRHGTPGTAELEPIFYEYGVDVYWAGHAHYYMRFDGPLWNGTLVPDASTHNPKGTLHVNTGNGGPPGHVPNEQCEALHGAKCIGLPYSYSRVTIHNATDLSWEQVANNGSAIIDSWTIHQEQHGHHTPPTRD